MNQPEFSDPVSGEPQEAGLVEVVAKLSAVRFHLAPQARRPPVPLCDVNITFGQWIRRPPGHLGRLCGTCERMAAASGFDP